MKKTKMTITIDMDIALQIQQKRLSEEFQASPVINNFLKNYLGHKKETKIENLEKALEKVENDIITLNSKKIRVMTQITQNEQERKVKMQANMKRKLAMSRAIKAAGVDLG